MHRSRRLLAVLVLAAAIAAATAARASAANISCWSDISAPWKSGSSATITVTWQCTPGIQQQMAPYVTLTAPDGTRYGSQSHCYSTTYCSVTVSAPMQTGTWTARAEYLYVVAGDGTSSYFFGGSGSAWLY